MPQYRLLEAFRATFDGKCYQHRDSTCGDRVSYELYEDLCALGESAPLVERITNHARALCVKNRTHGQRNRRGDGAIGVPVPGDTPTAVQGFSVARVPRIAIIEIGMEVKILAKAMTRQIDRVMNDLSNQIDQFRLQGSEAICVGIVGINHADVTTSYEGTMVCPNCGSTVPKATRTTGKGKNLHPIKEAPKTERRLMHDVAGKFDHFLILKYRATNEPPFPFEWVNYDETQSHYGSILLRLSRQYTEKFGRVS